MWICLYDAIPLKFTSYDLTNHSFGLLMDLNLLLKLILVLVISVMFMPICICHQTILFLSIISSIMYFLYDLF